MSPYFYYFSNLSFYLNNKEIYPTHAFYLLGFSLYPLRDDVPVKHSKHVADAVVHTVHLSLFKPQRCLLVVFGLISYYKLTKMIAKELPF